MPVHWLRRFMHSECPHIESCETSGNCEKIQSLDMEPSSNLEKNYINCRSKSIFLLCTSLDKGFHTTYKSRIISVGQAQHEN